MTRFELDRHWLILTEPLQPDYARREAERVKLMAAYEAPGRHYHSLAHIANLLTLTARFPLQDATVVELAIWYHDAVYNALRHDNEAKSADWTLTFLAETTLAPARRQRVADLIRRTQDHTQPQLPDDSDLLVFLDADLSILGAPEAAYWDYARQVRHEYHLVPDLLYRPGRRKVLAKLLEAPVLFHTPALRAELDASARRNLQMELNAWEQGGLPD
jgi:predicted metal-dependent HD superfamily phosphohydrolase